jgi:hypothetical protein
MGSPVDFGLMTAGADTERLVTGRHHDPHDLLGPHPERDGEGRDRVVIRGWRPDAAGMVILAGGQRIVMHRVLWLPNTPYGQAVRVVRLAVRDLGRR